MHAAETRMYDAAIWDCTLLLRNSCMCIQPYTDAQCSWITLYEFQYGSCTVCACSETRILDVAERYCTLLVGGNRQYKTVKPDTHAGCDQITCTTYTRMPVYSTVYLIDMHAASWDCTTYVPRPPFSLGRLCTLTRWSQARQTYVNVCAKIRFCLQINMPIHMLLRSRKVLMNILADAFMYAHIEVFLEKPRVLPLKI